jgi:hypothetical protein
MSSQQKSSNNIDQLDEDIINFEITEKSIENSTSSIK